jgi:hypothetical protein
MQIGTAGRQEAFAELFAHLHGGGTAGYIDVSLAMPRSLGAARAIIEALKAGQQ